MVAQPQIRPQETSEEVPQPSSGMNEWSPSSWRTKVARQMPKYDDPELVKEVEGILEKQAPLVFAGEVYLESLLTRIAYDGVR